MKWHSECQYMELNREYSISELAKFHGHLGPFIVTGYRIGRYALDYLNADPFSLKASIYCSGKPPESCIVDGVQLGSGCTLGKGNISVISSDTIFCEFEAGDKKIRISLIPQEGPQIGAEDYEIQIEHFAEDLYHLPDEKLFIREDLL